MTLPYWALTFLLGIGMSDGWYIRGRQYGPGRENMDPRPGLLCRIETLDSDNEVDVLLDLGCPARCNLKSQDVVWQDETVTGLFCHRPVREAGLRMCKVTSADEMYEFLDLNCPEKCELSTEYITWEGQDAVAHFCNSWHDDRWRDRAAIEADPHMQMVRRPAHGNRTCPHARSRPCRIVDDDGFVYLDANCPEDCSLQQRDVIWEDIVAIAFYCAPPETLQRHRRSGANRRIGRPRDYPEAGHVRQHAMRVDHRDYMDYARMRGERRRRPTTLNTGHRSTATVIRYRNPENSEETVVPFQYSPVISDRHRIEQRRRDH